MYRSSLFLTAALVGTTVALVQPVMAKSASEIKSIAKAVTVEIKLKQSDQVGSGVIINKKSDLYTLVTNRHVICGESNCQNISESEVYSLGLFDGQKYQVKKSAIKLLSGDLDLAIIQFRSNRNYAVAKVAAPGSLKIKDEVYASGFPCERNSVPSIPCQPLGYAFGDGKAIAVVNKRLTGDKGGYTIVYNAPTLPGMSGGGVFNSNGQLVAIHGQGDLFKENTELDNQFRVGSKIGLNRGIPIRWLVQNLAEVGMNLGTDRSISGIRVARSQVTASADEYFIAGFNKFVEPGSNVVAGKQQAIQEFSEAIKLNSRYQYAYFLRAIAYGQVQEFQKSLTDYNQTISINPKYASVYYNRGLLKVEKLNDIKGALADYNQAILLDPKDAEAYNNRAVLKEKKLNDVKGALADYNQTISINPKYASAYYNRGLLKVEKLNDVKGALADYNQTISINPKYASAYNNRGLLKVEKLNDVKGALADYNQAISINPKYALAYYNLALLKEKKLNDVKGALADYNQAISINPKYALAYYDRALLKYTKLNDIPGALADFNKAIILNPKYSAAYNNRGLLKVEKLNDVKGALADYNQAISINPKYSKAYYNRALLKEKKLNDIPGALADYNRAIKINPEYSDAYYNRALLKHIKLNDISGALVDYNQAIKINPKYSAAYYNRALLEKNKLNDIHGAIQDFRQAARLFREQGNTQNHQLAIKNLQLLGATE
jgi:tetratricopeptide (TPR) repeat protein/V8-like Glu-specific endopeptidase